MGRSGQGQALALSVLVLGTWLPGCGQACQRRPQVKALQKQLELRNVARAERGMRQAAQRLGAELLPLMPQMLHEPEVLPLPNHEAFTLFEKEGPERLAIHVKSSAWVYARLARRGNSFFVLEPALIPGEKEHLSACVCDAGYGVVVEEWPAFVVEKAATVTVLHVAVPMIEDTIMWHCKLFAI